MIMRHNIVLKNYKDFLTAFELLYKCTQLCKLPKNIYNYITMFLQTYYDVNTDIHYFNKYKAYIKLSNNWANSLFIWELEDIYLKSTFYNANEIHIHMHRGDKNSIIIININSLEAHLRTDEINYNWIYLLEQIFGKNPLLDFLKLTNVGDIISKYYKIQLSENVIFRNINNSIFPYAKGNLIKYHILRNYNSKIRSLNPDIYHYVSLFLRSTCEQNGDYVRYFYDDKLCQLERIEHENTCTLGGIWMNYEYWYATLCPAGLMFTININTILCTIIINPPSSYFASKVNVCNIKLIDKLEKIFGFLPIFAYVRQWWPNTLNSN